MDNKTHLYKMANTAALAGMICLALAVHTARALAAAAPTIGTAGAVIDGNNATIWADNVTADEGAVVERVWAQILLPGTPLHEGVPLASLAQVELSFN